MKIRFRAQLLCLWMILLVLFTGIGHAAQVTLAWDPNREQGIAGYKIYYGTASRIYNWFIDVGNSTSYTVTNLPDGATFYFAATAYDTSGVESTYSNEAFWTDIRADLPVSEITIGTRFTITGAGLGTRKGKVLIGNTPAKIDYWSSDAITCIASKVPLPAGPHDVIIKPQPYKIIAPLILPGTLTVMSPEIILPSSDRGSADNEIIISGRFFGTKKGTIYLQDPMSGKKKKCKIRDWSMDLTTGDSVLTFVVPKSLAAGTYSLKITNKVGAVETMFTITP